MTSLRQNIVSFTHSVIQFDQCSPVHILAHRCEIFDVAPIAQLAEHFISNEEVFGSIPNGSFYSTYLNAVTITHRHSEINP
jgi:hypothetical protein